MGQGSKIDSDRQHDCFLNSTCDMGHWHLLTSTCDIGTPHQEPPKSSNWDLVACLDLTIVRGKGGDVTLIEVQ